jgi:hypothetical protein
VKRFKKLFLFLVGVAFMAYDEIEKSVEEAIEAVEEQSGRRVSSPKPSK